MRVELELVLGQLLQRAAVGGEGPASPAPYGGEKSGRGTPGPPVSEPPGSERVVARLPCGGDGLVCL